MPIETVTTITTGPARQYSLVERHGVNDGAQKRQKQDSTPAYLCCPCLFPCLAMPCCADEICTCCCDTFFN